MSNLYKVKKNWKKRCYLHSVQHSYENRSCKPEIKYFLSVNHQFTGVNHWFTAVYSGVNLQNTVKQQFTTCKVEVYSKVAVYNL